MTIFVIWVVCVIATAILAANKGRSVGGWLLLGLLLGPIALLLAAVVSNRKLEQREHKAEEAAAAELADSRPCPYCAEQIKRAAIVCRYCGRDVPPPASPPAPPPETVNQAIASEVPVPSPGLWIARVGWTICLAGLAGAVLFVFLRDPLSAPASDEAAARSAADARCRELKGAESAACRNEVADCVKSYEATSSNLAGYVRCLNGIGGAQPKHALNCHFDSKNRYICNHPAPAAR